MASRRDIRRLEDSIRRRLRWHIRNLGFSRTGRRGIWPPTDEKFTLRSLHRKRRAEHLKEERGFIKEAYPRLKQYFASGSEVRPEEISARLQFVDPNTESSDLFRLASLTWGVPVSAGYGRRMRFLVWDYANSKLMGLIGLADPVFNLKTRDAAIGWTSEDRDERLVDVMNAYVLGAVPPYNMLLGGKVVSCLVRTREVRDTFSNRYRNSRGVISGKLKRASLVMITTSSSLGRSALYDRLSLGGVRYFEPVGFTSGWGHFHVPNTLFKDMRLYLKLCRHPYAEGNAFGEGSNWRLRVSRATLKLIGMNGDLLNHGVKREVFLSRLASNADSVLRGEAKKPVYKGLLSVSEVSRLAVYRWVVNRAATRKEYLGWSSARILNMLDYRQGGLDSLSSASTKEAVRQNTQEGSPLRPAGELSEISPRVTLATNYDKSDSQIAHLPCSGLAKNSIRIARPSGG